MHVRGSGSRGNLVQAFATTGEDRGGRSELAIVSAWRQGFGGAGLVAAGEREKQREKKRGIIEVCWRSTRKRSRSSSLADGQTGEGARRNKN